MTVYLSNRDGNGKTSEEGHYRLQTQILTGDVLGSTSLQVTQNSPAAMNVLVLPGDFKIYTGANYSYTGWNTANVTLTITTADPSNPRITTIVAYVDKGAATSTSPPNNPGIIKLTSVNGTPGGVPVAPNGTAIQSAVGAGNPYIILADVRVNAGVTSIVTANITDRRTQLNIADNLIQTQSLRDSSVTTAKLADASVSTAKIIDANVTTAKIADSNVTTAKIGNNQVTAAKIEVQQTWIAPTLLNGWANFGSGFYTAGYYKDSLGIVHLRGLVKSGSLNTAIYNLPAGYRPSATFYTCSNANGAFAELQITATGDIKQGVGSTAAFSMDNISFKAEQ